MSDRLVFHLTTGAAWAEAEAVGAYRPASLSTEGFIHCSNPAQVPRVARERFAGEGDLLLLAVSPLALPAGVELVDEPGDPGSDERFPHVYGEIPTAAVRGRHALPPPPPPGEDDEGGTWHGALQRALASLGAS